MLQKIAKSKSFDLLGVLIVVAIAIASGYLTETLADVTHWGHWTVFVPFGIISIINSILSIYSTRLTGRMNNLGNVVGIANVVLSGTNGLTDPLFWITVIAFGLSLGANVLNAMKFEMQWKFWVLYDFIQLAKAGIQGNFANIGKYVYYIINAIAALAFWRDPLEVTPASKVSQKVDRA